LEHLLTSTAFSAVIKNRISDANELHTNTGGMRVMNVFNMDALLFVFYFITPGVVALWMHDQTVPSEKRNWGELLFGLLSYGGLNLLLYTLLTPVIQYLLPVIPLVTSISHSTIDGGTLLWIDLILPAMIGFTSGVLPRARWFQKLFRGVVRHPDPTPWDHVFSDRYKCYGLLFHLKTGEKIAGIYGGNSYVSAYPLPQEIYVEHVCLLGTQGELLGIIPESAGALITRDACNIIELLHLPLEQQRSSLWQKILHRRRNRRNPRMQFFTRWLPGNNSHSSKEKDRDLLSNPISTASFPSEEVALFLSTPPPVLTEDREHPAPPLSLPSQGTGPVHPLLHPPLPPGKETPTS
jgi:hypothetical protein